MKCIKCYEPERFTKKSAFCAFFSLKTKEKRITQGVGKRCPMENLGVFPKEEKKELQDGESEAPL